MKLHDRLEEVFRQVFDNDALELRDQMKAADIEGWDSVAHINLIFRHRAGVRNPILRAMSWPT
ncbi:MAG: hypothetical protein QM771_09580 [Nitrospira sp.]